jgi:hypothetical protein
MECTQILRVISRCKCNRVPVALQRICAAMGAQLFVAGQCTLPGEYLAAPLTVRMCEQWIPVVRFAS